MTHATHPMALRRLLLARRQPGGASDVPTPTPAVAVWGRQTMANAFRHRLPILAVWGLLTACQSSPPPTFESLQVESLSDAERTSLQADFQPRLREALKLPNLVVHEPIAVMPRGVESDTKPGPVKWEVNIPMIDLTTGQGYVARLGKDRSSYVVSPLSGDMPLLDAEATQALKVAHANPTVAEQVDEALRAGWTINDGAMWTAPTETCTGRCVDVRMLGQRHAEDGTHEVSSIVHAMVSLEKSAVVSTKVFDW